MTKQEQVSYRPGMLHQHRWLWLLVYGVTVVLGYPGTVHSEEIIPRGSVISTVAGTATTVYTSYSSTGFDEDQFLTTIRFRRETWGERAAPWIQQLSFEMSHGYATEATRIEAGVMLRGGGNLRRPGAFGRIDLASSGTAHVVYRNSPEYDVDLVVPVGEHVSVLVGGFRREISVNFVPAFETPFVVEGNPTVNGVYGGIGATHRNLTLHGTMGTAVGSLPATVVPSDIGLIAEGRFDGVYRGTVGYRGTRLSLSAGASYTDVRAHGRATVNARTIGAVEPVSKTAGSYQAWHADGAVGDTFQVGIFQHRLRLSGLEGYLDLSQAAPILNGLVPDRFNYTISDISADLTEAGVSGWFQTGLRRWYLGLGGVLSFYTAQAEHEAFYRRTGLFGISREDVGATLIDTDGFLLTTSGYLTVPLVPTVTLAVSYVGVVPVSFDYLKGTDAATIVRDSAEAAGSWQGSRVELTLRVAAPSIAGR